MLSLGLTILVVTWTLHQDFARGVSDVRLVLGFSFEERSLCMFAKFPFANTQLYVATSAVAWVELLGGNHC